MVALWRLERFVGVGECEIEEEWLRLGLRSSRRFYNFDGFVPIHRRRVLAIKPGGGGGSLPKVVGACTRAVVWAGMTLFCPFEVGEMPL